MYGMNKPILNLMQHKIEAIKVKHSFEKLTEKFQTSGNNVWAFKKIARRKQIIHK